jgi:hypothetical protein
MYVSGTPGTSKNTTHFGAKPPSVIGPDGR